MFCTITKTMLRSNLNCANFSWYKFSNMRCNLFTISNIYRKDSCKCTRAVADLKLFIKNLNLFFRVLNLYIFLFFKLPVDKLYICDILTLLVVEIIVSHFAL